MGEVASILFQYPPKIKYHTHAIIICGLYIFYTLFDSQKRFFQEVFFQKILSLCMDSIQE